VDFKTTNLSKYSILKLPVDLKITNLSKYSYFILIAELSESQLRSKAPVKSEFEL
jgi:hypothetical protein